jgi:hypothetical protein
MKRRMSPLLSCFCSCGYQENDHQHAGATAKNEGPGRTRCWKREFKSSQHAVTRDVTCDRLYPVIPDSDRLQIRTDVIYCFIYCPDFFRFIAFHLY